MSQMRATVLTRYGGPEVLECHEVERPQPRADQMLVRVGACGVCGHDLLSRQGHFPDARPPCVIGHEIAGTVEEVGELVTAFQRGQRVALTQRISCGVCRRCRAGRDNLCRSGPGFYGEAISGGYGEFVLASPRNSVPLPGTIPFDVGAILSCAVGTGLHALRGAWARAKAAAGLPPDLRIHDLRHSFASALANAGIPLFEIGTVLGHRQLSTTTRYAHHAPQRLVETASTAVKAWNLVPLKDDRGEAS